MPPRTWSGRWLKRVRKRTVSRSRNPLSMRDHAVLGPAVLPRPVADHDLADAEAAGVRQHRDEPVQLAVDADLIEHGAAIELEAAVVVVQVAAGHRADHPVEDAAGVDLVPGVVAGLLPAADDVVPFSSSARKRGTSAGSSWRSPSMVKTTVAARGLEAGHQRGRLAEIAAEPDRADPRDRAGPARSAPARSRRGCRRRRRGTRPGRVRAAGEHGRELGVQRGQALLLVVHRDDDADT